MIQRAPHNRFGWRGPAWDARNENYRVNRLVGDVPIVGRGWRAAPLLDQGNFGICAGASSAGEAGATPVRVPMDAADGYHLALALFDWAADNDPWEGDSRLYGTSTLAVAQAMVHFGFWTEYYWARTMDEVGRALMLGPVLWGTYWYGGMMETDSRGFIHPTGGAEGGHLVYLRGNSVYYGWKRGRNSWGPWGIKGSGDFLMRDDEMGAMIANGDCEFCCGVGRAIPAEIPWAD